MCYILPTTYFLPNKTFLLDTYDIILIRIDFERIWISDHNPINNNYQAAPPREPPPTRRYNIRMRVASLVTLRSWWWFEAYCQQDDSSAAWTLWFEHRKWNSLRVHHTAAGTSTNKEVQHPDESRITRDAAVMVMVGSILPARRQ